MPLKLFAHLEEKAGPLRRFADTLADSPTHLARAEASWRSYERARAKILEDAPTFYEIKGVVAGLKLSGPVIMQHQAITKKAISDDDLQMDVGKQMVQVLGRAATSVLSVVEDRVREKTTAIGKMQGVYWAAVQELDEVASILAHFESGKNLEADDDEDWSGRGGNGQREVHPTGADVVPLEAARSSKNGSKKKTTRKKATRKKARKKPREEARQATPPEEPN
jgi:hypothetical protein